MTFKELSKIKSLKAAKDVCVSLKINSNHKTILSAKRAIAAQLRSRAQSALALNNRATNEWQPKAKPVTQPVKAEITEDGVPVTPPSFNEDTTIPVVLPPDDGQPVTPTPVHPDHPTERHKEDVAPIDGQPVKDSDTDATAADIANIAKPVNANPFRLNDGKTASFRQNDGKVPSFRLASNFVNPFRRK